MRKKLRGQPRTEAVAHQLLDERSDIVLRVASAINELYRHAGVGVMGSSRSRVDDPRHFTVNRKRAFEIGHNQAENKFSADRQRSRGFDKRAATGDVFGVIGEERIEPLVLNFEFNRLSRCRTPVFFATRRGLVVGGHATL